MAASEETYAFKNVRDVQRERLRALEALLDAGTIRHLERLGVQPGWRCLEAGAGGGSIAGWLADRVGSNGQVLAVTSTRPRWQSFRDRTWRSGGTTCSSTTCRTTRST